MTRATPQLKGKLARVITPTVNTPASAITPPPPHPDVQPTTRSTEPIAYDAQTSTVTRTKFYLHTYKNKHTHRFEQYSRPKVHKFRVQFLSASTFYVGVSIFVNKRENYSKTKKAKLLPVNIYI